MAGALSVRTGVPDAADPAYTLTLTVAESPGAVPAAPENAGVAARVTLPAAGAVNVTLGAVVSIVNDRGELDPVFPALSGCVACAVYVPSASPSAAVTDQPPPAAVAENVRTGLPETADPAYKLTVIAAESPLAIPAAPANVGLETFESDPAAGVVSVTAGCAVSTVHDA